MPAPARPTPPEHLAASPPASPCYRCRTWPSRVASRRVRSANAPASPSPSLPPPPSPSARPAAARNQPARSLGLCPDWCCGGSNSSSGTTTPLTSCLKSSVTVRPASRLRRNHLEIAAPPRSCARAALCPLSGRVGGGGALCKLFGCGGAWHQRKRPRTALDPRRTTTRRGLRSARHTRKARLCPRQALALARRASVRAKH